MLISILDMIVILGWLSEIEVVSFGYVFYHLGTGKSSIVCAICLGLGGSPNLLGRAKEVSRY